MSAVLAYLDDMHRMRTGPTRGAPLDLVLYLLDEPGACIMVAAGMFSLTDAERTALRETWTASLKKEVPDDA